MTLNQKTVFEEINRENTLRNLKPLKRLIAIFMIAMIAFACSRSDRHVSLPTNNNPTNPSNPNKPGFQDDGNGGMLVGVEGSLVTGKAIKFNSNVTIPGTTAISLNIDKGYYNIRTTYDKGLINWSLKDGDTVLAELKNDDNPAASFDVYFATAKNYQFALTTKAPKPALIQSSWSLVLVRIGPRNTSWI